MINEKIDAKQLLTLIIAFEIGSAIIFGIGFEAKQNAWLAILTSTVFGLLLYFVYTQLFYLYPGQPLIEYIPKIVGSVIGYLLGLIYIAYFTYLSARVLRDFGELVVATLLPQTPLVLINAIIIFVLAYAVHGGLEVTARLSQLLFPITFFFLFLGTFLLIVTNYVHISNFQPVLAEGIKPVIKAVFPLTVTVPFGELVLFSMLFPYLNNYSSIRKIGYIGIIISGVALTYGSLIIVGVHGVNEASRFTFPLLTTMRYITIGHFIEHLDVIVIILMAIGGFFKIILFYFGAVIGTASLFQFKDYRQLVFPVALIILSASLYIASSYIDHIEEGLKIVPIYLHVPLQVILPIGLLMIANIRKRINKKEGY